MPILGSLYLIYGTVSTDRILRGIPDGDRMYRQMLLHLTNRIGKAVAEADKQTRDTREIFGIPDAASVLVILNEVSPILDPELVAWRISELLRETSLDGTLRYPENAAVLVLAEANPQTGENGRKEFPVPMIYGPGAARHPDLRPFLESLLAAWARFNGAAFFMGQTASGGGTAPDALS